MMSLSVSKLNMCLLKTLFRQLFKGELLAGHFLWCNYCNIINLVLLAFIFLLCLGWRRLSKLPCKKHRMVYHDPLKSSMEPALLSCQDSFKFPDSSGFLYLCEFSIWHDELLPLQTCVSHVPHRVLEGPDDGVQDQFELGRGDGQEGWEALGGGGLKEVEEMGSVFWEFFKVLTGKITRS